MDKPAREIAARLREAAHIAYFAGGCVRDILRGVTPKDFDIATNARPEEVQKLFPRTYAVGAHFGVIVVVEGDFQFEVATFRSDDAYIDGRHPSAVHFSSPEEDAKRRDFTINGMFFDPVAAKVIDLVGARARCDERRVATRTISSRRRRLRAHAVDAANAAGKSLRAARLRGFISRRRKASDGGCRSYRPDPVQRTRSDRGGDDRGSNAPV